MSEPKSAPRDILVAFLKETMNRAVKAKDPADYRTYTQCACDLYEALSVDGCGSGDTDADTDAADLPRRVESND